MSSNEAIMSYNEHGTAAEGLLNLGQGQAEGFKGAGGGHNGEAGGVCVWCRDRVGPQDGWMRW